MLWIRSCASANHTCAGLFVIMLACCTVVSAQAAGNQHALKQKIIELQNAGKYTDAVPVAQSLVELARKESGEMSLDYADALEVLGSIHIVQSRSDEAEALYQRSLAIREKVVGATHKSVLSTLDALANVYRSSNRPQLAEPLLKRVLAERERQLGPTSPQLVESLSNLAQVETSQQRFAEAEALVRRALSLAGKGGRDRAQAAKLLEVLSQIERGQGRLDAAAATLERALALHDEDARAGRTDPMAQMTRILTVMQLATLYQQLNRIDEAGKLAEQSLGVLEKLFGPDHPTIASSLSAVASMRAYQGRYVEAEAMHKRAIAINERSYGPDHLNTAISVESLGHLYRLQDRLDEALPLLLRSLQTAEKNLGPNHVQLVPYLAETADVYKSQRRYQEAEALFKRALAILEAESGGDQVLSNVLAIRTLQSLSFLYQVQGRHAEARPYFDRALAVTERVFGPDHFMTGGMLTSLSILLLDQDRIEDAERLIERALPISAKSGSDTLDYAANMLGRGMVRAKRKEWAQAYSDIKTATAIYIRSDKRAVAGAKAAPSAAAGHPIPHADAFLLQASTAYRLAEVDTNERDRLRDEAFQMAQRAQNSQAATALGQMSVRLSSGSGALAGLIRERQDRAKDLRSLEGQLNAAFAAPTAQRSPENEARLRKSIGELTSRLDAIDTQVSREFPAYAALSSPEPLSIAATQGLLAEDEVVILVASRVHHTLVWVIAKDKAQWGLVPLPEADLAREVAALRCGLDAAAWTSTERHDCASLLKVAYAANKPLPFDLVRAHGLYQSLLGPFEDLIRDKHLMIATSGPLATLPFAVLVSETPETAIPADAAAYGDQAWLGKRHAVSVLPSVASLKSLRGGARNATSAAPFIGFGNPLLSGRDGTNRSAWSKQSCPKTPTSPALRVAAAPAPSPASTLMRGALGNTEALRQQSPLPETADELCEVARRLGADARDVHLGERATEKAIKALNMASALARYRVVHFATHGLLAGETESLGSGAEPSLLLTPPETASDADDGLLTASEVAEFKLDAEWVVLSACNSAGADNGGGEALSGLARAFFYAGARALLVTHWYVDSDAAVKLVTTAFAELKRSPDLGRAEALRRAAVSVMGDQSRPAAWVAAAHPSVWAPFVVVGEGGAVR